MRLFEKYRRECSGSLMSINSGTADSVRQKADAGVIDGSLSLTRLCGANRDTA
jgi:hypothetical protein